jgi:glycosyltransferase involved in cell wall biosynthesis
LSIKIIRVTTVPISLKILLKDQLKFIDQYFDVVGVSSEGKELYDVARDEGIRTIPLNMTRQFTPFKDLIALIQMIILFRKESPSIVHSHTPKAGVIAMLAAWLSNVPNRLHTVAGLPVMDSTGLRRIILLAVEWLTCRCATKIYPNSRGLKEFLNKVVGIPSTKLKIIGSGSSNGVDTRYFNVTPELQQFSKAFKVKHGLEDCFVFTFIGRIVKDKGIEELLEAYAKLSDEHDDTKLLIVGTEEPMTDPISSRARTILESNKGIVLTGFLDDIRPALESSDSLVLPSYREGFPNVVLQAACMSVPSIVSDISGCNEIIQDRKNGLVVPSKSANDLYHAMKKIASDREFLIDLAAKSRDSVIEKYDRQKFHQMILAEYKSLFDD